MISSGFCLVLFLNLYKAILFFINLNGFDMGKLSGKKVAILTENGFEEVELTSPMKGFAGRRCNSGNRFTAKR